MRAFLGLGCILLFGCGPSTTEGDGAHVPVSLNGGKCEGEQPVIQDVRWLGTAAAPGKVPIGGIGAEVGKTLAMEQDVSVTVRQVNFTPITEDSNLAMAKLAVKRGANEKEVSLGRQIPGGFVCYQKVDGLWVGLVETVPNKAMVRVGLPIVAPAPPTTAPPEKK